MMTIGGETKMTVGEHMSLQASTRESTLEKKV